MVAFGSSLPFEKMLITRIMVMIKGTILETQGCFHRYMDRQFTHSTKFHVFLILSTERKLFCL